jgi:hypothetical protein
VQINDRDGVLDPTNASGPYYGDIDTDIQAVLCRWNPVAAEWDQRFRGFVDDWDYDFDKSQRINRLTLSLTGIFEPLNRIEMLPGEFGDTPPSGSEGQVWFDPADMDVRILQVLANASVGAAFYVVFSGNVSLRGTVYTPGESVLTVIQEAANAEFPGVSNVYEDRFGRLVVHGRLAKFDPAGVIAGLGDPTVWDWHDWEAGDSVAVAADPAQVAHIRGFGFNRGRSRVYNSALVTSIDPNVPAQTAVDLTSIGQRGYRSWSAQNLITNEGLLGGGSTTAEELQFFADYIVDNYATPHDRPTGITFRSMRPSRAGASENWRLMSKVDISDRITIDIASPGGGGFTAAQFYVEGIREESRPANPDYDDDTVTLYVSPAAYFEDNPFPVS